MDKRARRNWLMAIWASGVFIAVSAVAVLLRDRIRAEIKEIDAESPPNFVPAPKSSDEIASRRSTVAA